MPFPVIPIVVTSSIAALITYVGVRMAMDEKREHPHDGIRDLDETAREGEKAKEIFRKAGQFLEVRREQTQGQLEALGRQKAGMFESVLIPFEETFSRIRNVDLSDADLPSFLAKAARWITLESSKLHEVTAHMRAVVAVGVDALAFDALAALAACGSAGISTPASASGGPATTPSSLAASNATLAWLRGGTFPECGSTVILGGVAAAPVLLVNGFMLPPQAGKRAVEQAVSNLLNAEVAARDIDRKATEVRKVLKRLMEGYLADDLAALRELVSANDDYRTYDRPQKTLVARAASLTKMARDVAEAPLLGKNGEITDAIGQALKRTKKILKALETA